MKHNAPCLLLTRDDGLARRLQAYLAAVADLRLAADRPALLAALRGAAPALALVDVRGADWPALAADIREAFPRALVIALGVPRSVPLLAAEALGLYGVEDVDCDGWRLQALVRRGLDHLRMSEELRLLREQTSAAAPPRAGGGTANGRPADALPLRHCLPALRHAGTVEALLACIVDGMVAAGIVLRAGIFARDRAGGDYRLMRAFGVRDEAQRCAYAPEAPLARWLESNARLVARAGLEQIRAVDDRLMLQQALDAMGAELIVPLQGRRALIGWLFLGQRATGLPFDAADLQDILVFAEHVSSALENAALYEEIAFQHTLAETLLHSIPTGIAMAGPDARVVWFNDAAEKLLGLERAGVMGRAVEILGGRLADQIRRALTATPDPEPLEWTDPPTQRCMSVRTARLVNAGGCVGAVAFIHDLTRERRLNAKQEELERAAFWTELAAAISHEIRNPMVAIKTFAQLLPERYQDVEFRNEFRSLVASEVDRLNGIIEQINDFAHRPELRFRPLQLPPLIARSVAAVLPPGAPRAIRVQVEIPPDLPPVWGDERSLVESFTHLVRNAVEALEDREKPCLRIAARLAEAPAAHPRAVEIEFRDNGRGIPAALLDKAFSPFCTTKARGLGLGLPIVRRAMVDHNGSVALHSSERGTTLVLTVPLEAGQMENDETHSDCR
jgi:PAS domain S-box-containing protein